jgi:hypothetical protein
MFSNSKKDNKELAKRREHELKVEELTAKLLSGDVSIEEYKRETKSFDYRLDLRRAAAKLD